MSFAARFLLLLLFSQPLFAAEIVETFSSRAGYESGTAIWNQGLGAVHPTLQVMNYKGGFVPLPVDVGDGRHGAFEPSTYARFSVGGDLSGNIIRFNTAEYPILQVTSFHLAPGWRIEPVGDSPFVVYSLSDIIIEGEIWCQGHDGGDAVNATRGLGGEGRCGGKRGGDGGTATGNGSNGEQASASVLGGYGGQVALPAVGGGGGGSWNATSAPGNGPNFSAGNGQAGTNDSDPEFLQLIGGAGGGGGGGSGTNAGAGGGGGGGLVILHAVRDFILGTAPTSMTGFIYASGGRGGVSNANGGAGGGGGGGGVKVFVGGSIEIYNEDVGGASLANNGTAASGAVGGSGRSWFSSVDYNLSGNGFYTPSEEAPLNPGNVEFSAQAQHVVSITYDLLSSRPGIGALPVLTPLSADFTVELRGSSDNFSSDDTGWTTDVSLLEKKRYVRYRLTITTSDVNHPTMIDTLTLTYSPQRQDDFQFKASGCGRIDTPVPPSTWFLPWMLLLGVWGLCRRRVRGMRLP